MSNLNKPAVVVNFKVYSEIHGPGALELAQICEQVSEETGIQIAVCPPTAELAYVARSVKIPVFAQSVDPRPEGTETGWNTPSLARTAGAVGNLVNHAEHRLSDGEIGRTIGMCRTIPLETMVCADTPRAAAGVATFEPTYVALEPPELIGGDLSVTKANPKSITESVELVRNVSSKIGVLCGAGIKSGLDVAGAIEMGAVGVLVASGVVRAVDPKGALLDLVKHL
jgi:triosephosphate isomerase